MASETETTENIGRDSTGRFATGNPGRPKGARHKLGEQFLYALQQDFEANGVAVIAEVRDTRPHEYLKVIASLMPKDLNLNVNNLDEASDDELVRRLRDLEAVIRPFLGVEGSGHDSDGVAAARPH